MLAYASAQQTAYVFFSSLIVLNAALLIATSYRVLGPAPSVVYTYLDKDIPLDLPVGPVSDVEMTFQESSRFGFDEDSKLNWETLFTNQFGLGFSHLGPYHFRSSSDAPEPSLRALLELSATAILVQL